MSPTLLEKGTIVRSLLSVATVPLQYLAPAMGTEGGQAVWNCGPGQKSHTGLVLSQNAVTALSLHNGLPWLCLLNVLYQLEWRDLCGPATMVVSH